MFSLTLIYNDYDMNLGEKYIVDCFQLPGIHKFTQLNDYLIINKLIDPYRSDYTRHHSTEIEILNVFDNVLQRLSKHRPRQSLQLDVSAAFDTIDHEIWK